MQQKEVQPISFLFHRVETTLPQLASLLPVAQQLYAEAVSKKLTITGPIHWHYFGFTGDVAKSFTLEICLPVAEVLADYDGSFHFKRTEPFRCVSTPHEGAWTDIPQTYDKIMQFIGERKLAPSGVNREVYTNVDFVNPEANISVIQMGIQ